MKYEIKRKLVSVIFPERCPYCRDVIKPCEIGCEACLTSMPQKIYRKLVGGRYRVISALPYKDIYKAAILRVKFGNKKQYAYQLAKLMASKFSEEYASSDFDVITFVPLHNETLKERGFNQSELLARHLSEFTGIPCEALLKKTKKNKPQHNVTADKKEKNVKGVYRATDKTLISGKKILIIDDIVTTGFTLAECAKTLDKNGAEEICGLTFAITLPKTT